MQTVQESEEYTPPTIRLWVSKQSQLRQPEPSIIKPAGLGDCPQCSFGLINPPPLTGSLPLYRERCLQFDMHELTFCECQVGQDYRRYLAKKSRTENEHEAKEARAFNRSAMAK